MIRKPLRLVKTEKSHRFWPKLKKSLHFAAQFAFYSSAFANHFFVCAVKPPVFARMKTADFEHRPQYREQTTQTDFHASGHVANNPSLDEPNIDCQSLRKLAPLRCVRALPPADNEHGTTTADIAKVSEWGEWLSREFQMEEDQSMRLKHTALMLRQRGSLHANDSTEIIEKSITRMGHQHRGHIQTLE